MKNTPPTSCPVAICSPKGLMQQLANLASHGYRWIRTYDYSCPAECWQEIDGRLLERYRLQLQASKDQRYRRQKAGLNNAKLLRLDSHAYILATDGTDDAGIRSQEGLTELQPRDIGLPVGGDLVVELTTRNGHWTWSFSRESHAQLKNHLLDAARRGNRRDVQTTLDQVVTLVEPKGRIRRELTAMISSAVKEAKMRRFAWKESDFFIRRARKAVPVYQDH